LKHEGKAAMALIETTLKDDTTVLIEVESREGLESVGAEEVIKKIQGVVKEAAQTTVALAREFTAELRKSAKDIKADSLSLQMGIKLGAEGTIFIARASTEANIVITLTLKT
jgi:hypothetical protein